MKILKELPWSEGMGKIINLAFVEEPVAVSFILGNLNKVSILLFYYFRMWL